MADQLYLSYWLDGFSPFYMLRHYSRMLKLFPYSRLALGSAVLRIIPIDYGEPAILERVYTLPEGLEILLADAKEVSQPDCCLRLETSWDLWVYDHTAGNGDQSGEKFEWQLAPSRAALCCYGPGFEKDLGENLRIEFGIETHFLPQPDVPGNSRMTESNVKSLLKLVHDLDDALSVQKRQLWSESGENFADKLQQALSGAR